MCVRMRWNAIFELSALQHERQKTGASVCADAIYGLVA